MDKSHVSLEQKVCVVCSKQFDTNAILLHKQLRPVLEHYTVTGVGVCSDCGKEGFIVLIEIDPSKSIPNNGLVKPENAYKTGRIAHIKHDAFDNIFSNMDSRLRDRTHQEGFSYVDPDTMEMLERIPVRKASKES
jgi:hypothetical protein